jgi:hypothetical protein
MNTLKIIATTIVVFLVIDLVSLFAWAMSEQTPMVDGYWFGKVTYTIINSIIN